MEWGSAYRNFQKGGEYCAICHQLIKNHEIMDCDANMVKPGYYVYWHQKCYANRKKQTIKFDKVKEKQSV